MRRPLSTARRGLAHAAAAFAAAVLVVVLLADGRAARSANLNVEACELPVSYLIHHNVEPGYGFLVDRRSSTTRRDDGDTPEGKRRVLPMRLGEGIAAGYALVAKRYPTVLLVPLAAVEDWSYPFVHMMFAADHPEWPLAALSLRRLYVDRAFRGIYLQVELPYDKRKKDGGNGDLRTLLAVTTESASRISTRWEDGPGALMEKLAIGRSPKLALAPAPVAWLASAAGGVDTTLLLDPGEDGVARLSPLPISLAAMYRAALGRAPSRVEDLRFASFRAAASASVALQPPDAATRARRDAAYADYLRALIAGVRLQAAADGLPAPDAASLSARLQVATRLGIRPVALGGA